QRQRTPRAGLSGTAAARAIEHYRRWLLDTILFLVPEIFGDPADTGSKVPAVGAERQPEPIGRGLLLRCGIEICQIEDAVDFLVPRIGEKRLGCLREHGAKALRAGGDRS